MGLFRKKKHQAISLPIGAAPVPASVKFRGYFLQTLKPGMTVLDVGASWGAFALPAARTLGPSGQVIAHIDTAWTHHVEDDNGAHLNLCLTAGG